MRALVSTDLPCPSFRARAWLRQRCCRLSVTWSTSLRMLLLSFDGRRSLADCVLHCSNAAQRLTHQQVHHSTPRRLWQGLDRVSESVPLPAVVLCNNSLSS